VAREVPTLSRSQREAIRSTVVRWAAVHPKPDRPIIQLADGSEASPRDMAQAVGHPESRLGRYIFRVFAVGLIPDEIEEPETLQQMLDDFGRDIELWRSGHSIKLVEHEEPEREQSSHEEELGLE
jgi:hypothetical protein